MWRVGGARTQFAVGTSVGENVPEGEGKEEFPNKRKEKTPRDLELGLWGGRVTLKRHNKRKPLETTEVRKIRRG